MVSRLRTLVVVRGRLTAVASLAGRTGSRVQASVVVACGLIVVIPRLYRTGSVVVVRGLSCSVACGIFLDQGLNLCLLHWQAVS